MYAKMMKTGRNVLFASIHLTVKWLARRHRYLPKSTLGLSIASFARCNF